MEKAFVENIGWLAIKAALLAGVEIMKVYNNDNFDIEYKTDNSPLTIADKKAHETIVEILSDTKIPIISEEGADIPYETRKKWDLYWLVDPLDGTKEFIKRNGEFTVNIALIEKGKPIFGVILAPVLKKIYFGYHNQAFIVHKIAEISNIDSLLQYINQNKTSLPFVSNRENFIIVASRSHLTNETKQFIDEISTQYPNHELISVGSSLKFCLIAEGSANIYPRFSPTMEWDTAAGQAIVEASGGSVMQVSVNKEMEYNKENLLNPWFIVKKKQLIV